VYCVLPEIISQGQMYCGVTKVPLGTWLFRMMPSPSSCEGTTKLYVRWTQLLPQGTLNAAAPVQPLLVGSP